jgi:hypothetical protein
MKNDLVYRTENYITEKDVRGSRICGRLLVVAILALVAAIAVSSCSAAEELPVQVSPREDQGVDVGVKVDSGWFASAVNPKPEENNFATVLLAVPRFVEASAKGMWRNKLTTLGVVAGGVLVKKGIDGDLDDLAFWEDKEEKDEKGFKTQPEVLKRPKDNTQSHQQLLATRNSCQFLGSSSQQPTLDATFGASGSSACHIDLKPVEARPEGE